MAGVVIHVARTGHLLEFHALLKQKFVDVQNAAARENALELIALQLIEAGAARHHDRTDVEIVEGVGHPVKQHPVVGDDLVGLVELTRAALRIAATEIARRQHSLNTHMPEHRLGG